MPSEAERSADLSASSVARIRPCTPRKRLIVAKEVDRETGLQLAAARAPSPFAAFAPSPASSDAESTPQGDDLHKFCEAYVGRVMEKAVTPKQLLS
ncbi:hypothetical protein FI667_g3589, partial [Globisporangium splendens]